MGNEKVFTWKPTGTRRVVRPVENPKEGEDPFQEVDEEWPFEGEVVVKMANAIERLRLTKECRVKLEDGKVVTGDGTDTALKLLEIARDKIKVIKLKRKEDGFEFNNIDDLEYDRDGTEILTAIGSKVLEGVQLGKN